MPFSKILYALWLLWAASWLLASQWSSEPVKSVTARREMGHRVVSAIGAVLLAVPAHRYEGALRLWRVGFAGAWACVLLMVAGFSFCWWARLHLGRLWSGRITRKEDHRIVDTGPYGIVRHPIYAGLLLAAIAAAAAKGTVFSVAGAAGLVVGLWMKARIEERWLRSALGAETYDAYRRRVPMLLPFARPSTT